MKVSQLLLALAIGISFTGLAAAQDPAKGPQRPHRPGGPLRAHILKKFDKDGDGKLNDAERAAAKEQFKTNHPDLFDKIDANDDGDISLEERQAARAGLHKRVLEKFDADHDGKLNDEERQAAKAAARQRIQQHKKAQ